MATLPPGTKKLTSWSTLRVEASTIDIESFSKLAATNVLPSLLMASPATTAPVTPAGAATPAGVAFNSPPSYLGKGEV